MKLFTLLISCLLAQDSPSQNRNQFPGLPQIPGLSLPNQQNPQQNPGIMDPNSSSGDPRNSPAGSPPGDAQSPQQINQPGNQGPLSNFPLPPSLGQPGPGGSNGPNGPSSPPSANGQGPKPSSVPKSATSSGTIQTTIKSQNPEASKVSDGVSNTSSDHVWMIVLNLIFSIVYYYD